MDTKPFPTLKTHILTTLEATSLIDWEYTHTKVIQYPLPTEVVVLSNQDIEIQKGLVWPSKSEECEFVGSSYSSSRNDYRVAQVYTNVGQDGHTKYALYGWLHITTHDLKYGPSYDDIPMYKFLFDLYRNIEEEAPTDS